MSYIDTLAVIAALMEVIQRRAGSSPRRTGKPLIAKTSEGAETVVDKVSVNSIKRVKVAFRPGADFRKLAKTLK